MKLWIISQEKNNDYDTYDSAVVAADTEEQAKSIHPDGSGKGLKEEIWSCWVGSVDDIECKLIGDAIDGTEPGVICASFNAT